MDSKLSKKLANYLRHDPQSLGIKLDGQGWTEAQELVAKLQAKNLLVTWEIIKEIADQDLKGRYSYEQREGKFYFRANQGHSVRQVKITFPQKSPPLFLYHGTTLAAWQEIKKTGNLLPMKRHHVHLCEDIETAQKVASRRKVKLVVLKIQAQRMEKLGYKFYLSDNGIWLASSIPLPYLQAI